MELLIAELGVYEDEQLYQQHLAMLPEERQERVGRCRHMEDKRRSVGAGMLLEHGLNRYGYTLSGIRSGFELVHISLGSFGKPYILEREELCFNLSHAGGYAAVVFAETAVGVDLEQVHRAKLSVAERFFTKKEYTNLLRIENAAEQKRAFARMWTRKESYIKAQGEGMHLSLADFCVLEDQIPGDQVFYLYSWEFQDNYVLSVCAGEPVDVRIEKAEKVDLRKVFDGAVRNNYN